MRNPIPAYAVIPTSGARVSTIRRIRKSCLCLLSFAGQIERGESMPSVETLALIMYELNIDPRLIFIDGEYSTGRQVLLASFQVVFSLL